MDFKVGDTVKITGKDWLYADFKLGQHVIISQVDDTHPRTVEFQSHPGDWWDVSDEGWEVELTSVSNSVNPNHYVFPGGVEVRQISAHLTSFGGQAVQYVARATRLDGQNKGEAVEDLKKAVKFLQWEIERIEQ